MTSLGCDRGRVTSRARGSGAPRAIRRASDAKERGEGYGRDVGDDRTARGDEPRAPAPTPPRPLRPAPYPQADRLGALATGNRARRHPLGARRAKPSRAPGRARCRPRMVPETPPHRTR